MFGPDEENPDGNFSHWNRNTSQIQSGGWTRLCIALVVTTAVVGGWLAFRQDDIGRPEDDGSELVLYCAHDVQFSEPLVAEFERETGVRVTLVSDTEANKSLGLTRRIEAERTNPQADVFWNNQLLGTLALARQGLFQSHADALNRARFSEAHRDANGLWTAFGARLRVWIVDPNKLSPDAINAADPFPIDADFCVADPMFGTTLTHAAVLWGRHGRDAFVDWYESLPRKGVRVLPGNSATRDLVVDGVCSHGWTDTDDFFGAEDRGAGVAMRLVETPEFETIAIPNSVAVIKNCRHPKAAGVFVDWLLSETVERRLANGPAAQVPLGTLTQDEPLSERVMQLQKRVSDGVDLTAFVEARDEVLEYLSGSTR